jgi:hypothetical protein
MVYDKNNLHHKLGPRVTTQAIRESAKFMYTVVVID